MLTQQQEGLAAGIRYNFRPDDPKGPQAADMAGLNALPEVPRGGQSLQEAVLCELVLTICCRGVEWDAVELPSQFMENWYAAADFEICTDPMISLHLPVLSCKTSRQGGHWGCRCYHRSTLDSFARHYESGDPLPDDLFKRLVAAKNFR